MDKESVTVRQSERTKLAKKKVIIILLLFALSIIIAVGLLAGLIIPKWSSLFVHQPTSVVSDEELWLGTRLPRDILPLHYDLTLFPDLYQPDPNYAPFYGNVSILINITSKPTRHLIVHANELTIRETTVRLHQTSETTQDEPLHVQRSFNFSSNQYWVVELDRYLQAQSAVWLHIRFDGSMTGKWTGLYRTSYVDSRTQQTRFRCRLSCFFITAACVVVVINVCIAL